MTDNQKNSVFNHRWNAVKTRKTPENEEFYYGVSTTGIFCRPGCSSRTPKQEHVRFFESVDEAVAEGYRPCKRCRPDARTREEELISKVIAACREIEETDDGDIRLDDLARTAGLSTGHFQRVFKEITGLSPKEYSAGLKAQRFRTFLSSSLPITDALYEAGYGSAARLYDQTQRILAMKPSVYRKGGVGMKIQYGISRCALGYVLAAFTDRGVCAVELGDDGGSLIHVLKERFYKAEILPLPDEISTSVQAVVDCIDHPGKAVAIPVDIRGSAFQEKVWRTLTKIPPGETRTYSQVAAEIGRPKAARAVANACAENRIAVAVPCHRVIRSDGGLGGYRWGLERKEKLLKMEREHTTGD